MGEYRKIAFAYSGGFDATVMLKWLLDTYKCEVITVTPDIGQPEDLLAIEEKAIATGASKALVVDLREDLARDYIFPMMRAAARYEGRYLLGASIDRPCITHALVEVAAAEGAEAVAHSDTGNDQARFEFAVRALDPALKIIAPWREANLSSREALIEYAQANGITQPDERYSADANMLHTSFEGAELNNPALAPEQGCRSRIVTPEEAPDESEEIEVGFVRGNPVSVNGQQLQPYELIVRLGEIAGRNGIGRDDMVENRYIGLKCRSVYENPAGSLLFTLHRDLEGICMDRELLAIRDLLSVPYSHTVYDGYWFSPEREAMQAFFDKSQATVTGRVRAKLYKGNILPLARTSPYSLFSADASPFAGGSYDHNDAEGFIRINSLRLGLYGGIRRRMGH